MRLILTAAVLLLLGCSDSTGPKAPSIAGTYTLTKIDGEPLPYEIIGTEILSGTVSFRADGTYTATTRSRYEDWDTGEWVTESETEAGTYEVDGSRYTIDVDGDRVPDGSGTFNDLGMSLDVGLFVLTYARQ